MIVTLFMAQALASAAGAAPSPDPEAEIVVTATQRPGSRADVPAAIATVSAAQLRDSGGSDIRQLNQLVPSLLVSSSSSEAGGGGARVRGIGTVGDNAGLESSVATFVDGVYRSRAGVALTELGPIERIELLSGPQGTLFGRNASAGLISITTAQPKFTFGGSLEAQAGNYDHRRLVGSLTGPLGKDFAVRLDGVYAHRDGFIKEVVSGRRINGRERGLGRAKLLYRPDVTLSVTLALDYSKRDEECCVGVYLPSRNLSSSTPGVGGGRVVASASTIAALIRGFTSAASGAPGIVMDGDPYARRVALTPGRSFRQDVEDGGASLTVEKDLGGAKLSSITAWRGNRFIKGQDADFSNLDLTSRPSDGSGFIRFKTFTQELRLRGAAFAGKLDWLIGGYLADERLTLRDNLSYGVDYDRFIAARIGLSGGATASFPSFGFANLNGFIRAAATAAGGAAAADAIGAQVQNVILTGDTSRDRFSQHGENQAIFTHDIVHLTDRLSLTLGARYTRDVKALDASLVSTSGCGTYVANIQRLRALAAASGTPAGLAALATGFAGTLAPLTAFACNINSVAGDFDGTNKEHRWSGTAALGWKITTGLNVYGSWSRGYKAGGYNLDRAGLFNTAALAQLPLSSLAFKPETVDALEIGAKFRRHAVDLDVALFHQSFRNFQLNTFTGTNFIVSNIQGCKDALGAADSDAIAGNSPCANDKAGVISKGVELNATFRPARDVTLTSGFTYADTRYARDLAGSPDALTGNNSLPPVLFLLPGARLSNAPAYTATGSARWTPLVGARLRALVYADIRYQSRIDTGSDLLPEKAQKGFAVVNARLGLARDDSAWSVELWAQNVFNVDYKQIGFSQPLQGGGSAGLPGTQPAVARFGTTSSQLFGAFLGEPRTWGLTVRRSF